MRKYLIYFYLLCFPVTVFAQINRADNSWKQFYQRQQVKEPKSRMTADTLTFLVQLPEGAAPLQNSAGITVLRRLGSQLYIARVQPAARTAIALQGAGLTPANDRWKLAPSLPVQPQQYSPGKKTFLVTVTDTAAWRTWLQQNQHLVQPLGSWPSGVFRIHTTDSVLYTQVLPLPFVQFADRGDKQAHTEAAVLDFNDSFDGINAVHARYPSLRAAGLTASVKEDLFDTADIDLRQRIVPNPAGSRQLSAHATTMATIIGGAGNSYYTGRGVTDACTLSPSSFASLLPDTGDYYRQYQVSVQNHSYGVGIENYYGSEAAAYDAGMYADTVLLHVFSAGNSGNLADTTGRYRNLAGFANLTGNFKMAKNVVTVGAVDSLYSIPLLSSKGPAYDGRIKPELVAYGQGGSSGAAALTSGTVLLLQDAYRKQYNGNKPASALLKALLFNSADDIAAKGPDFSSGYGLLNAQQAVATLLAGRFMRGTVQAAQSQNFTLTVPPGAANLKITLVWNDVPAQPNAFTALVNDLDLVVAHAASGNKWLPWVLNSYPQADSLQQPASFKRDSLNTTEQVSIDSPAAGLYTITVNGYQVSNGSQPFYLAYQWDTLNSFQWNSPVHTDNFVAGSSNVFKWKNLYPDVTGELSVSYDAGLHWIILNDHTPLYAPYYRWTAPDTFATRALARMKIGNRFFTSDTFSISRQAYPQVGFNCSDSLLLHWPSTPGATAYRLYTLKSAYLEPVRDLTDTFAILYHPDAAHPYYAVASLDGNGRGMNSYAVAYNEQGVSCYFNNFLADLSAGGQSALLNLQLGVLYDLQSLSFEKQTGTGWHSIRDVAIGTSLNYSATDSTLTNGLNTYRAVLTTVKGQKIYSDPSSVYYWQNGDYILFPNPVPAGQYLQVLSKDPFNKTLCLYNMQGQKVWQQTLQNTLEQVPVNRLPGGVYVAVLLDKDNKKLVSQKIVVR